MARCDEFTRRPGFHPQAPHRGGTMTDEQQIRDLIERLGHRGPRRRPARRARQPRTRHRHVRRAAARAGRPRHRRLPRDLAGLLRMAVLRRGVRDRIAGRHGRRGRRIRLRATSLRHARRLRARPRTAAAAHHRPAQGRTTGGRSPTNTTRSQTRPGQRKPQPPRCGRCTSSSSTALRRRTWPGCWSTSRRISCPTSKRDRCSTEASTTCARCAAAASPRHLSGLISTFPISRST